MLGHVSLGVRRLERSRRFYHAALRPLGLVRTVDFQARGSDYGAMAGQLGVEFTITVEQNPVPLVGMHRCFRARDRSAVRAFHYAALAAGGTDDGEPGLRLGLPPGLLCSFRFGSGRPLHRSGMPCARSPVVISIPEGDPPALLRSTCFVTLAWLPRRVPRLRSGTAAAAALNEVKGLGSAVAPSPSTALGASAGSARPRRAVLSRSLP